MYLYSRKPHLICLQETWLRDGILPNFINYEANFNNRQHGRGGGMAILVRSDIVLSPADLQQFPGGLLEVQRIKIKYSNTSLDILNVYNPNRVISLNEWSWYFDQLGPSAVVVGDMNAHHNWWTTRRPPCNSGYNLVRAANVQHLQLLTPLNMITYLDAANFNPSTLDLCFVSSHLYGRASIGLSGDMGSDHCPVWVQIEIRPATSVAKRRRKWLLENGNWPKFMQELPCLGIVDLCGDVNVVELLEEFNNNIKLAAINTFKTTSNKINPKYNKPWWSIECSRAVAARRRARSALLRQPSRHNVNCYRNTAAEARRIIANHKAESKIEYINTINSQSPISEVWNNINRFRNTYKPHKHTIVHNNEVVTDAGRVAGLFADHFRNVFGVESVRLSELEMREIQTAKESMDPVSYNCTFGAHEMAVVISNLRGTSPGHDDIHNEFLKHLPDDYMDRLLLIINAVWDQGSIPMMWKQGIITLIPKKDKPLTEVSSFRPISLLPCVGKVMERMVCKRLYWLAEANNLLSKNQSGFRRRLCTTDQIARIEKHIRDCLIERKFALVVFLDLSAAYDTVDHKILARQLVRYGTKGKILKYVINFLEDRQFAVLCSGELSNWESICSGVPQGSPISPLLFNLFTADMPNMPDALVTEYADDIAVAVEGGSEIDCSAKMRRALSIVSNHFQNLGLVVNNQKTKAMIFSSRHNIIKPQLHLNHHPIEYVTEFSFLGVVFDSPLLQWRNHVAKISLDSIKRSNLLKAFSHHKWGADRQMLLTLYKSLVLSRLNYGAELMGGACKTLLASLEPIQNNCLRLIIGARQSSPVTAMQVELHVPPLSFQRDQILLNYFNRVRHLPDTLHLYSLVTNLHVEANRPWTARMFPPVMVRAYKLANRLNLTVLDITPCSLVTSCPPWEVVSCAQARLHDEPVDSLPDSAVSVLFSGLMSSVFLGCIGIYTDGTKMGDEEKMVAAAMVVPERNFSDSWRLPGCTSIYTAELFAIDGAMDYILRCGDECNYVVFTDSLSSIQAIVGTSDKSNNILLLHIKNKLYDMNHEGLRVRLEWVPSHRGIPGNELADAEARAAVLLPYITLPHLPKLDGKVAIGEAICAAWQLHWDAQVAETAVGQHIRRVKSKVKFWPWSSIPKNRKIESLIARLRIGHCGLNAHLYRFGQHLTPLCTCGVPETVAHFLVDCPEHHQHRQSLVQFLRQNNLQYDMKTVLGGADCSNLLQKQIVGMLAKFIIDSGKSQIF